MVTGTVAIQTKMIFVEGENTSFRLDGKHEPQQPTPSIPSGNKRGFKPAASERALTLNFRFSHILTPFSETRQGATRTFLLRTLQTKAK